MNDEKPTNLEIEFQAKLEECDKLSLMKDEKINELDAKVKELQAQILEISESGYKEMDSFIKAYFQMLFDERKRFEEQNMDLKSRLLKEKAQKHKTQKLFDALKLKNTPYSPKSPSDYETENQKLKIQISELNSEVNNMKEQLDLANREIENKKKENDELINKTNSLYQDAAQNFKILRQKLDNEREKMKSDNIGNIQIQNESLLSEINEIKEKFSKEQNELHNKLQLLQKEKDDIEKENSSYQDEIKNLKQSNQETINKQTESLNSLNQIVGCQSIEESLAKVRELTLLPIRYQKLQEKIDSIRKDDSLRTHDDVIDAIKEINEKLSPNYLKLPDDSVLRQLFKSLCNMFNAVLSSDVSKKVLDAHVLSVVYQARSFVPSDISGTDEETKGQIYQPAQSISRGTPSFFQMPDAKQPY